MGIIASLQHTFPGGVHPNEGKELSMSEPIRPVEPGEILRFPMSQHIGAPAEPVVQVGDHVKKGQLIGKASGFVSANIYSSVSGDVVEIAPHAVVGGGVVPCVVINRDHQDEAVDHFGEEVDVSRLSKEEILERIKNSGIVGMGGAGFPTHVKLMPKNPEQIDHVIVNGAECEPYLTSDYRLMMERSEDLIEGLRIVLSLFPGAKGVLAIEKNKPEAIARLEYLTQNMPNIQVLPLKTKYPQGAERQIIYVTTGRRIYSRKLPAEAGCIVDNVQTILAIYDGVARNIPSISRVMTITGNGVKNPGNVFVPYGMSHKEVMEQMGGFVEEGVQKMISGGPMMGIALYDLDVPVTKTSSSILATMEDEVSAALTTNCIRCGRCVKACPSHLVPQMMADAAERRDLEMFQRLNGMECYECGSCTYVCPAKRKLTQSFKQARRAVQEEMRKKA